MEHPTTPPPTTTASAAPRIMTGTTLCSGMESGGEAGHGEESHRRIAGGLLDVWRAGVIPIDLGGDHSIALPELRALAEVHGKVGLIQLDSHSDTSEAYFDQPHTHGTPIYHAVREGLIEPSRSIQVGLRGPIYSDRDYAIPREMGIEVITGVEAHEMGMAAVAERIAAV